APIAGRGPRVAARLEVAAQRRGAHAPTAVALALVAVGEQDEAAVPARGDADQEVGALVGTLDEAGRGRRADRGLASHEQRESERGARPAGHHGGPRPPAPAHAAVTPPSTGSAAPV